jgi:hypothetical protein
MDPNPFSFVMACPHSLPASSTCPSRYSKGILQWLYVTLFITYYSEEDNMTPNVDRRSSPISATPNVIETYIMPKERGRTSRNIRLGNERSTSSYGKLVNHKTTRQNPKSDN